MNEILQSQLESQTRRIAPVKQSVGTGNEYATELRKLIRAIRKDIDTHLTPVLKSTQTEYVQDGEPVATMDAYLERIASALRFLLDKWTSPSFRAIADRVARQFVTTSASVNQKRFARTMESFGINTLTESPALSEYLAASAYDNARLIQSIPEQYLARVESVVMSNVRAGNRSSVIARELAKQYGITDRRAKLIARDQTAKINGDLVELRQRSAGFEFFKWVTVKDERVRDRHSHIAEAVTPYGVGVYRWDKLPLSDDGRPIKPGSDYQCRCTAQPITQAQVDAYRKNR